MEPVKSSFPARVYGIVPAAGWSRRMGRPKQLIDVGGRTMLEDVLLPLIGSRVAGVMLVTRQAIAAEIRLQSPKLRIALNDTAETEMIDSIRIGIEQWRRAAQPGPADGFMILPADQPGLTSSLIDDCIGVFEEGNGKIVVASHAGRRGHPLIFPEPMAQLVLGKECDAGLNRLLKLKAEVVEEVVFDAAAVTRNVNTPGDL